MDVNQDYWPNMQNNIVKIPRPYVHIILKDARVLLVTSKGMAYFSSVSTYVGHSDLVYIGDTETQVAMSYGSCWAPT